MSAALDVLPPRTRTVLGSILPVRRLVLARVRLLLLINTHLNDSFIHAFIAPVSRSNLSSPLDCHFFGVTFSSRSNLNPARRRTRPRLSLPLAEDDENLRWTVPHGGALARRATIDLAPVLVVLVLVAAAVRDDRSTRASVPRVARDDASRHGGGDHRR